ncbi:dihydroneopterin triphosphate 2'-epimerase [Gynuella sp.]|uniref:dihydroneopterin triphosphate 2'-epimerase n=1 Tax=Gynuella sp. TaxID=2969146 RepID=UPI003D0F906B
MNTEARIRIKNLRLRTFIGIKDEEIRNRQDIVLNVVILFDATQAICSTDIETTLNYRTITKEIISFVENNHFALLEKLTNDVLEMVMKYSEVKHAEVEIDKPHALRFADSVSVSLSRSR